MSLYRTGRARDQTERPQMDRSENETGTTAGESAPVACQAKVTTTTTSAGQSACKGTLELTPAGLLFRGKPPLGKEEILEIPWDAVRELKIQDLGNARSFSADFGGRESNAKIAVQFIEGDWPRVKTFLEFLPESTRQKKCPSCGGPVHESVCARCGKDYRQTQKKHALAAMAGGLLLATAGIFLAVTSGDPAYGGLVLLGGLVCALGFVGWLKLLDRKG